MKIYVRAIFIFAVLVGVAYAADQTSQPIAIKAGRLLDVKTGRVRSNVFLVVQDGKIASVADSSPSGAKVIDLSNALVLPGLIDCHVHLLLNWKNLSSVQGLRTSSAEGVLLGLKNVRTYLQEGFTTLRDAGEEDLGYGQLALRNAINTHLVEGPRLVSAGNFVSVTGGHGDGDVLSPDQSMPRRPNIADTVEEIGPAVRHDLKYGVDWIKLMASGGVMDPWSDYRVQELSEEQMARAVEIAHRAGKRVMAHAEGTAGIRAAVRAGVDSIEHGTMLDEESAAMMEKQGTWLVPTLSTFQHVDDMAAQGADPVSVQKGRDILKYQQPAFELALKHHLHIAFGLDDDPEHAYGEFGALVRAGMSPLQAIQAATVNASQLLGLDVEIGTLEPGKSANIIAVSGDPLKNIDEIKTVVFVMKDGTVFRNDLLK